MLHKLDEPSLSKLVHDHDRGKLHEKVAAEEARGLEQVRTSGGGAGGGGSAVSRRAFRVAARLPAADWGKRRERWARAVVAPVVLHQATRSRTLSEQAAGKEP